MKAQNPSPYNKIRVRVGTFLTYWRAQKWLDDDPLVSVGKATVVKEEKMRLSPSQLHTLPDHTTNERDRIFIVAASHTAIRANELLRLRIRDVDLEQGYVHVRVTKSALEDKMPISNEFDAALRRWFREYSADIGGPLEPDFWLS
ncbi:hypothetical protein BH09ACT10_BH09ACT10_30150 [soil metagenome]